MRLLANENFPGETVRALRARGHDVVWVRTDAPGASDREVLAQATNEARLILTFDKDFGELAFRHGLEAPSGIVLFRISPASPVYVTEVTVTVLESRADWEGHFAVIEEGRVRMVPLPPSPEMRS
jgi:predicted nuclease of predicted toxin-antitoxin system